MVQVVVCERTTQVAVVVVGFCPPHKKTSFTKISLVTKLAHPPDSTPTATTRGTRLGCCERVCGRGGSLGTRERGDGGEVELFYKLFSGWLWSGFGLAFVFIFGLYLLNTYALLGLILGRI